MNRRLLTIAILLSLSLALLIGCAPKRSFEQPPIGHNGAPKYVFLFIGDGMGPVQPFAAEIYLDAVRQRDANVKIYGAELLTMTRFPVRGTISTYAANTYTTDSAASGTALATGHKTDNGMISVEAGNGEPYVAISELLKARGMKIGIITSVAANDATPAVFYAHQSSRGDKYEINVQIPGSCVDFLAGSSLPEAETALGNSLDAMREAGMVVVNSPEDLDACKPGQRVVAFMPMPFELDRPSNGMTLARYTRKAIEMLDNPDGFFMMVEGGKIDHAGHYNDARVTIEEVLAFNEAVDEAVKFYRKHPLETLIVITSDHETGGMSLGTNGKRSPEGIACLADQKMSWSVFNREVFVPFQENHTWASVEDSIPDDLKLSLKSAFGLVYDDLSDGQKQALEDAYDRSMGGEAVASAEADSNLYAKHPALPVAAVRVLNERAGISWGTWGHTPCPIPVRAMGPAAYRFDGFYDNTGIPKRIAEALRVELPEK